MAAWLQILIVLSGAGAATAIAALLIHALKQAGRDGAERDAAEHATRVAKRQGEIMAEQREPDDAAQRLDRGTF